MIDKQGEVEFIQKQPRTHLLLLRESDRKLGAGKTGIRGGGGNPLPAVYQLRKTCLLAIKRALWTGFPGNVILI